jgi:hypothetical protein
MRFRDTKSWILSREIDFFIENRLANVVSHIGEIQMPKDFGKIMGFLSKDALEDFLKGQGEDYSNLDKADQKILNKELNKSATELIKRIYMNQS